MKAVNLATQKTLERFQKRCEEIVEEAGFEAHPYSMALDGLEKLNKAAWDEETEESALESLAFWVCSIVGKTGVGALNEILAVSRIARETGAEEHKNAALEMAASMPILEDMLQVYLMEVDYRHIAEWLFEDGRRRVAEMQKHPVPKKASGDWCERWRPSNN